METAYEISDRTPPRPLRKKAKVGDLRLKATESGSPEREILSAAKYDGFKTPHHHYHSEADSATGMQSVPM